MAATTFIDGWRARPAVTLWPRSGLVSGILSAALGP